MHIPSLTTVRRFASRRVHVAFFGEVERIVSSLSLSGRVLFWTLAGILIASSLYLLYGVNQALLVEVPAQGGSLVEGIVGAPRFINPLLAISDADRDLSMLIYSGLLKTTDQGTLIPDLAQDYDVSPDGVTYTFTLKEGATFHNGTPIRAGDVLFTVAKAQDPGLKSPKRANWDGITAEAIDDRTIVFHLKAPYAPFIENATLGILPKILWENVSSDEFPFSSLNTEPVGSGPFRVASIERSPSGIPTSYTLKPFRDYALGKPFLEDIEFRFFENERDLLSALERGAVDSANSLSPGVLAEFDPRRIERAPLNRVFGVFFNQNQSEILRDKDVRKALALAIDREGLVQSVLGGYGTPLYGPVPAGILEHLSNENVLGTTTDYAASARDFLGKKGWTWSEEEKALIFKTKNAKDTRVLSFALSTTNAPELRVTAEYLRKSWEVMGARVEVKIFEQGDLNQNVIRPRKYDALLFGEVVGRELDLFAFWHSSQRNDPGLNIALYANSTADKLLEGLRVSNEDVEKRVLYKRFAAELEKDAPAVFLYTPDFMYVFPERIEGLSLGSIGIPSERFLSAHMWHTETDRVWSFFTRFTHY